MRYLLSELATLPVVGKFTTLDTVTITVYDLSVGSTVALDDNSTIEIAGTGYFIFNFSNLTTQPTTFGRYLWVMSNGSSEVSDVVDFAGWSESVEPLGDSSQCKITVNLYNQDGSKAVDIEDLFSNTTENYIEVKTAYYQTDRYFQLGKIKPSYDILTKQAFWVLPQGATFDLKLTSFGLSGSGKTVPSTSTATLYSILNA